MVSFPQHPPAGAVRARLPAKPPQSQARRWGSRVQALFARRAASPLSLAALAVIGACGWLQLGPNLLWVLLLLGIVGFEFQSQIDRGLPLTQLAALIAVLQWTVGAMLVYSSSLSFGRYGMAVDASTYFGYAIPGTAAFALGLLAIGSSVQQRELFRTERRRHFLKVGIALNVVALAARLLAPHAPPFLAFFIDLLSQLGYVGVIYFLFAPTRYRWPLVALGIFPLLQSSAAIAMFHDLLLWTALIFCYWYSTKPRSFINKVALLTGVAAAIFTLQAIKPAYRAKLRNGEDASLVGAATNFWSNPNVATNDAILANEITRLNQGWIIAAVLKHIPESAPFARGETVSNALVAALVPRFLMPDKVGAGGRSNFTPFTGLDLDPGTSMGVSPLGEAYANYGSAAGILAIFVFGLLIAAAYSACLSLAKRGPEFLFWVPLIFYQAIKAETDFATVLNQITKGTIVAIVVYWVIIRHMNSASPARTRARYRAPDTRVPAPSVAAALAAPRQPRGYAQ